MKKKTWFIMSAIARILIILLVIVLIIGRIFDIDAIDFERIIPSILLLLSVQINADSQGGRK
jgi:hypothetical protein